MRLAYELASTKFVSVGSEPQSAVRNISFGNLPQTLRVVIKDKTGTPVKCESVMPAVTSLHVDGINCSINFNACYIIDFIKELLCSAQPKVMLLLDERWHLCNKVYLPVNSERNAHAY